MDNNQETKIVDLLERDGAVVTSTEKTVIEKPYKLRKLNSKDISPMIKVLKKIDLKRFKAVIQETKLIEAITAKKNDETVEEQEVKDEEKQETNSINIMEVGGELLLEAIPILLDVIDIAIPDANKLLAGVANLTVEEIENLDLDVYFSLIYDFITKPEFTGFIKAVSKFIK